ncbi:MAG TPA: DUF3396 domain-containing protein [Myxococcaceae bacterium]|jgi:hypothetical protein
MTAHYPRIRFYQEFYGERFLRIRDSISICFYMKRPHQEVIQGVLRSLEVYRQAISPHRLGWYVGLDGNYYELDDPNWESIRSTLLAYRGGNCFLSQEPDHVTGYEFCYRGLRRNEVPEIPHHRESICAAFFWLPTEYLETHGPARVRTLALELASGLPFSSGHAGLSFQYPESILDLARPVRDLCLRYPGFDLPTTEYLPIELGTRIKGVHWINFLGPPVLDQLGGVEGLRSRFRIPGTTVEPLGSERAVVTLGEWPEAGDLEQGLTLPAHRELARVLEPWLYNLPAGVWRSFTKDDMSQWDRRFLDPQEPGSQD